MVPDQGTPNIGPTSAAILFIIIAGKKLYSNNNTYKYYRRQFRSKTLPLLEPFSVRVWMTCSNSVEVLVRVVVSVRNWTVHKDRQEICCTKGWTLLGAYGSNHHKYGHANITMFDLRNISIHRQLQTSSHAIHQSRTLIWKGGGGRLLPLLPPIRPHWMPVFTNIQLARHLSI